MTGKILTVKEYAARQGMTEQAVYKQIKTGKLLTIDRQENGKQKKYIFCQDDQEPPAGSAPEQAQKDTPPGESAAGQNAAALEKAVAALTAQLEEKDRQINRLTELLSQAQLLQAHSQKLLEQGAQQPKEEPAEVVEIEEEPPKEQPEEPKKRGFWAWLFGE